MADFFIGEAFGEFLRTPIFSLLCSSLLNISITGEELEEPGYIFFFFSNAERKRECFRVAFDLYCLLGHAGNAKKDSDVL